MEEKLNYITVQVRAPRGDRDLGQVEEAWWIYDDASNTVSLVTMAGAKRYDRKGKPLEAVVAAGDTARKTAWWLLKRNLPNRKPGFHGPLHYPDLGKI